MMVDVERWGMVTGLVTFMYHNDNLQYNYESIYLNSDIDSID